MAALVPDDTSTASAVVQYALWGCVAVGVGAILFFALQGPKENPSGGDSPKPKSKRRRAILKGRSCKFDMVQGRAVTCSGGMIHDPTGKRWPRNSVLCGPVRKLGPAEIDGEARDYLGSNHKASVYVTGDVPRELSRWKYIGEVDQIWYTRTGKRYTGRYYHPFSKPTSIDVMLRGSGKVRLYRLGRYCRLELPRGATLNWRGYVWP
jgi:hypothetical protein